MGSLSTHVDVMYMPPFLYVQTSSDVERSLLQMYGMSMGLDEDQMEIVEVLLTTHILF